MRAAGAGFGLLVALSAAQADEGMWTFDHFPVEKVARTYGFTPSPDFLGHLRRGSITLSGCSSGLVSARGLLVSNRHCVSDCLTQLSKPGRDMILSGFYAAAEAEETQCPALEAKQLVDIVPVTDRVKAALAGKEGAERVAAKSAIVATLTQDCSTRDEAACDVVDLYHGGRYDLYKYRRFTDVRLVFAPEVAIGFFGGDPDNFEFPRYDFDVSFLRLYEHGRPVETADFFPMSRRDVEEGQLVFGSGSPQESSRAMTLAQLEDARDFDEPRWLVIEAEQRGLLSEFQARGPEERRVSGDAFYSVRNDLKNDRGRMDALVRSPVIRAKRESEAAFRARIDADPRTRPLYGASWDTITARLADYRDGLGLRYELLENGFGLSPSGSGGRGLGFDSARFGIAKRLVRLADESAKPNGERLREFIDSELPGQRSIILSTVPASKELETVLLGHSLSLIREYLGPDDEDTRAILGTSSPQALAAALVAGTSLDDTTVREKLLSGGKAAIEASDDPMIAFARRIDPRLRAARGLYDQTIAAPINRATGQIAEAKFLLEGESSYPDATETPRVTYGQVKGFADRGRTVAPTTTVSGLFARAAALRGEDTRALDPSEPFQLPPSWIAAKAALNPNVILDFATTQDTLSGDSGSPLIDTSGRLVGIMFDGNFQSIGGNYGYDAPVNRSVAVASSIVLEALGKVYHASRLSAELEPGSTP